VLLLTGTQFLANTAPFGGGLSVNNSSSRIVNALFARNYATTGQGAAMLLNPGGNVQILHTTVASPTLATGDAIHISNGTVGISDTIVASYTTGINRTGGTAFEDYNLFFGTTISKTGTFGAGSGANDVTGNPKFANTALDNEHLQFGSAAINTGINVGVAVDFDGQPRPTGPGFDIGYDEFYFNLHLPLVVR